MPVVCFEGINGAGKQKQIDQFAAALRKYGRPVVLYHDPGISEDHPCSKIREAVLYGGPWVDPLTPLLLVMAAKAELQTKIEETLRDNPDTVVILDRYLLSTYVYQTLVLSDRGGFYDEEAFSAVSQLADLISFKPVDLIVLLNVSPAVAYGRRVTSSSRLKNHAGKDDRFEEEGLEFATRLAERYSSIMDTSELRDRLCLNHVIVDVGSRGPEEVFEAWWKEIGGDAAFHLVKHGGVTGGAGLFKRKRVRV